MGLSSEEEEMKGQKKEKEREKKLRNLNDKTGGKKERKGEGKERKNLKKFIEKIVLDKIGLLFVILQCWNQLMDLGTKLEPFENMKT